MIVYTVKVASQPVRTVITSLMHLAVINAIIFTGLEFKVDGYKPSFDLNRVSTLGNDNIYIYFRLTINGVYSHGEVETVFLLF